MKNHFLVLTCFFLGVVQFPIRNSGGQDADLSKFIAVDTSRLMTQPDNHAIFGVEPAFLHLKFVRPVDLTHAGDDSNRLFVVEQDGRIHVFRNDSTIKEGKLFLDLSKLVRREHNEEGMLGLAFHPKYRENGEFFVFYSVTPRGSVVSRFRVSKDDPDRADPKSEQKLLEFTGPMATTTAAA